MPKTAAIILAAGLGTRMKSSLPKVLHRAAGLPLIAYPLANLKQLKLAPVLLVVGKNQALVKEETHRLGHKSVSAVVQDPPLGTAHAVLTAMKRLKNFTGDILILYGDMPLLKVQTIRDLVQTHRERQAVLTFLTAVLPNPFGYGRVLRTSRFDPCGIVEEKEATPEQKRIQEINVGVYVVNAAVLSEKLKTIGNQNVKGEYYLTDLVALAFHEQKNLATVVLADPNEGLGVNTQADLTVVNELCHRRQIQRLMEEGVSFATFENVAVDAGVKVGGGTRIGGGVSLLGKTRIGGRCVIESGTVIRDSVIGDGVTIKANSYIEEGVVESNASIGPFARLRPGAHIGSKAKVGNFVEIKKTRIGEGSKVNHLSYIGDARIGIGVNIGAGTITCNYDGFNKSKTVIEDQVFVGSDTQFIAPVRIGRGAVIGAGSTITKNVKPKSLALTRAPQVEIKNWVRRKKTK